MTHQGTGGPGTGLPDGCPGGVDRRQQRHGILSRHRNGWARWNTCTNRSARTIDHVLRPKLVGDESRAIDRSGHVVAVCGAQGGAGATSIAVNLALQLAETTKARVALLDLHLQGGETAVMLGVQPGPGLRIALENPERERTTCSWNAQRSR